MDENKLIEDLFLREKPSKILMGLKGAKGPVYATILSKDADCTYSHTIKILNMFKRLGIVEFEKKGRIKKVTLTDDGWDIAHNLEAMTKKLLQLKDSLSTSKNETKKKGKKK